MKIVKLYNIRNWVRGLMPLYISICAALLLELKSNIMCGIDSMLYIVGLVCFGFACVISNKLANRCNDCGRIYDIKISNYQNNNNLEQPNLKSIYETRENTLNWKTRFFQHYGVFVFGILGLVFVIISYFPSKNQIQKFNNQTILQQQVDSLKVVNIEYKEQILKLKIENDSIKNDLLDYKNSKVQNKALPLKADTITNKK